MIARLTGMLEGMDQRMLIATRGEITPMSRFPSRCHKHRQPNGSISASRPSGRVSITEHFPLTQVLLTRGEPKNWPHHLSQRWHGSMTPRHWTPTEPTRVVVDEPDGTQTGTAFSSEDGNRLQKAE